MTSSTVCAPAESGNKAVIPIVSKNLRHILVSPRMISSQLSSRFGKAKFLIFPWDSQRPAKRTILDVAEEEVVGNFFCPQRVSITLVWHDCLCGTGVSPVCFCLCGTGLSPVCFCLCGTGVSTVCFCLCGTGVSPVCFCLCVTGVSPVCFPIVR